MDLVISGQNIVTRVFYNYGDNTFAAGGVPAEITARGGGLNLVDINGDGTLDISSFGWQSDWKNSYAYNNPEKANIPSNTAPAAPIGLTATTTDGKIILSWNKSTDDHTPQNAIRYNVYAKNNTDNTLYTFAPVDIQTGKLKVRNLVPLIQTNSFELKGLPGGQYTFGVQAVDQSELGSSFTTTNVVSITPVASLNNIQVSVTENKSILIKNKTQGAVNYTIVSMEGKAITNGLCQAESVAQTHRLQQGIYIVRLLQGEHTNSLKITVL